jgi:MFS transporter, CP family, cyanate transporter
VGTPPAGRDATVGPRHGLLLAAAVVLVAVNLRPAVAGVGPVLPDLRAGLPLSGTGAAVLTTLPVLCFGLLATAAPRLVRRFGIEPVLVGAMLALATGALGRVLDGPAALFAGTVVVGGAIAVGNVLIPRWSSGTFPTARA